MTEALAPEAILRASLEVLYVAAYSTRNWTLSDEVSRQQLNDLWEALHNVPIVMKHSREDLEGLNDLRMYFREYDEKWPSRKLQWIFDQALKETST